MYEQRLSDILHAEEGPEGRGGQCRSIGSVRGGYVVSVGWEYARSVIECEMPTEPD